MGTCRIRGHWTAAAMGANPREFSEAITTLKDHDSVRDALVSDSVHPAIKEMFRALNFSEANVTGSLGSRVSLRCSIVLMKYFGKERPAPTVHRTGPPASLGTLMGGNGPLFCLGGRSPKQP